MTDAEQLLWSHLRAHRFQGTKFRRQQPIGDYVVDFVHLEGHLIVEAHGGQHTESSSDAKRDAWLSEKGFRILRFCHNEILTNTDEVLERIVQALNMAPPSPAWGEGRNRPIRSFVLRQGRMTDAQREALDSLLPRYRLALGDESLNLPSIFGRHAPVVLEIGFGNGDALAALAAAHPEWDFIGVEVHRPGVGALLQKLAAANLANVRVAVTDVMEVLARLPLASLHAVHLFFPDPWPKKRHHKRRLLQPNFARQVSELLAPGGYFHCATDWPDYAEQMLSVLSATPGLANAAPHGGYSERPLSRPVTRFERRGEREGRPARDLLYRKV
jgi:tRNA (guanine-N7-)-methyltransferase